jgi:hypothetical protein
LKALILANLKRWKDSLAAADTGLQFDPDHLVCLNARAQALTMLGDRAGAATTVEDALRKNPDDPWMHANQGWASLHANEPTKAAEHFREALRLDPEMDFARAGIIEALKARNFVYRWMLQYFLWMSRMPSSYQWGIIIGLFLLSRSLGQIGRAVPVLAPFLNPLLYLYIAFVILSWLSYPLFNLLLRFDRFGRHALSSDQRMGANLLAATLGAALVCFVSGLALGHINLWIAAVVFGVLSLPVSAIYSCSPGWPRQTMFACSAALLVVGLFFSLPSEWAAAIGGKALAEASDGAGPVFFYGILGSQFLANSLIGVQVKK